MSRFVRPVPVFFVACLLAVLRAFRTQAFNDAGCLWHTVIGERILSDGRFMTTDLYTHTFHGRHWIPQQWGAEVLMAVLYRAGGFDVQLLGFAVGVAALHAWLFRRLLDCGMGIPLAAGLAVLALVCGGFHFYVRPHMVTIGLMAVTAGFLVDFDRERIGVGRLWWMVPIYVVWTNLHGGMLGGLVTAGFALGGWSAVRVVGWSSPIKGWERFGWLAVLFVALMLTMFVNPFGLDLQRTWFKIVGSPWMAKYVSEHQPLSLRNSLHQPVIGFAAIYFLVLVGAKPSAWRVTWLLPLTWLALSVQSNRQGPLFVVVAAVVLADVWPHTFWARRYGEHPSPAGEWRGWVLPALAVTVCAVVLVGSGWTGLNPDLVPVDLTDPVREYARSVPRGTPIYNDANLGGFLIFAAPELMIFMDDRFELYGEAWLEQYVEVSKRNPAGFADWQRQYRFTRALVDADSPLDRHLQTAPGWREVQRGRCAVWYAYEPPAPK